MSYCLCVCFLCVTFSHLSTPSILFCNLLSHSYLLLSLPTPLLLLLLLLLSPFSSSSSTSYFQISSSLVIERSLDTLQLQAMVLMFQREVAQRIRAARVPGRDGSSVHVRGTASGREPDRRAAESPARRVVGSR